MENVVLLEDWIAAAAKRNRASGDADGRGDEAGNAAATRGAHTIAYSWTQVRDCVHRGFLEPQHVAAMDHLRKNSRSLHVAESQAKLLVLLLTSVVAEDKQSLGIARASAAVILSVCLRKTARNSRSRAPRVGVFSAGTFRSVVEATCEALADPLVSDMYVCDAILLLGSVCMAAWEEGGIKDGCRRVVLEELVRRRQVIVMGGLLNALAGAGNAMVGAHGSVLSAFVEALLHLWTPNGLEHASTGEGHRIEGSSFLEDTLMLLHLLEFQGLMIRSYEESVALSDSNTILQVIVESANDESLPEVRCASVMASFGLLKSLSKQSSGGVDNKQTISNAVSLFFGDVVKKLENLTSDIARQGILSLKANVLPDAKEGKLDVFPVETVLQFIKEKTFNQPSIGLLRILQSLALGLTRNEKPFPNTYLLSCLLYVLLQDILNLEPMYSAHISDLSSSFLLSAKGNSEDDSKSKDLALQSQIGVALQHVQKLVKGCLFHEAGAIARAMCLHYQLVDLRCQQIIETTVWEHSRRFYRNHRIFVALCHSRYPALSSFIGLLRDETISKVLETYFLFIVLFFSMVLDHKISGRTLLKEIHTAAERSHGLAVQILDALSCVEFCRQVQLPEHGRLVQDSVNQLCASKQATSGFVFCCPSYHELTHWPDCSELHFATYDWNIDEVQAARIQFHFRVLCSCLGQIVESTFEDELAPKMFLYMQHSTEAVARSSHALFATFLSLVEGHDGQETFGESLREKLAVYYIQRSLEQAYPRIASLDGMVSGVRAIACYLPPGSPVTIYCIDMLVNKLTNNLGGQDTESWDKTTVCGDSRKGKPETLMNDKQMEAAKKAQNLLLDLVLLVDVQILPHLLQQVARLILSLPLSERLEALGHIFDVVAGTDDCTRKPVLVPWIQSLSFMCSKL